MSPQDALRNPGAHTFWGRVKTQPEWDAIKQRFKEKHPDMHGGDLMKAMKDELSGGEEKKVQAIMEKNGVKWQ